MRAASRARMQKQREDLQTPQSFFRSVGERKEKGRPKYGKRRADSFTKDEDFLPSTTHTKVQGNRHIETQ